MDVQSKIWSWLLQKMGSWIWSRSLCIHFPEERSIYSFQNLLTSEFLTFLGHELSEYMAPSTGKQLSVQLDIREAWSAKWSQIMIVIWSFRILKKWSWVNLDHNLAKVSWVIVDHEKCDWTLLCLNVTFSVPCITS